ncbi:fibronectin type III domain-containing protein [Streptomyces sp. BBFR51]|uniref:fibronectin type III domain-containing protein n=1 Tax=Streptomyces sp. BBFR51 TaxID=3372856 RepID=UPI0037DC44F9
MTGYLVTTWQGDDRIGTRTVARDLLETVVDGLKPGTRYRFTVAATNLQGTGEESAPTETVTPVG